MEYTIQLQNLYELLESAEDEISYHRNGIDADGVDYNQFVMKIKKKIYQHPDNIEARREDKLNELLKN
jgi:hypothetical protein